MRSKAPILLLFRIETGSYITRCVECGCLAACAGSMVDFACIIGGSLNLAVAGKTKYNDNDFVYGRDSV